MEFDRPIMLYFTFGSFKIKEFILRPRKLSYVYIHFLNKCKILFFGLYQSLRRLPCLICKITVISSGPFARSYRVTDMAFIAENAVWPIFFHSYECFLCS